MGDLRSSKMLRSAFSFWAFLIQYKAFIQPGIRKIDTQQNGIRITILKMTISLIKTGRTTTCKMTIWRMTLNFSKQQINHHDPFW
jgi:hypothetical protein